MNRRVLVIVAVGFALSSVLLFLMLRPGPAEEATIARTGTSTPGPAPRAENPPSPPAVRRESSARAPRAAESVSEPAPPEPVAAPVAAPPDEATLRIESDVPGAQVFIDRQFVGATPVTAEHVKPGAHQLNASADGFDGLVTTIDVTPGPRDVTLRFREVRLNATLAVIHKHRIGSCNGQLLATLQGLRYETTDKNDGFMTPLLDLDTFQVDYLEKNLRVKLRNGKQYNFADPAGNADHLFVFHRDVEKARERLRRGDRPATP